MSNLRSAAKRSYGNRQRWDEDFKDEQFPIPTKAARIRLFNEVVSVPMHWVEFFSKQKKKKTGFYELCINWDFDNEESVDRGCPMCEHGMRSTTYTYAYMLSRAEQRKGNLQVRPIRLTPKCTNSIIKLSDIAYEDEHGEIIVPEGWDDEDLPDATDPMFGFDIQISKEEKNGKTEYPVHVATKNAVVSLKKDELRAFKSYVGQVDFAELAKKGQPTVAECQQKLVSLEIVDAPKEARGGQSKVRADADYDAYDDVPEDGDDDDPVAPPKTDRKKKKKRSSKPKAEKRETATSDDDDLAWDEEDEAYGDDGEEVERTYAGADEDEAPDDEYEE